MWIQISSGQGPEECSLAVGLFMKTLLQELKAEGMDVHCIDLTKDTHPNTYKSVLLAVSTSEKLQKLRDLEGTIQWICKSPYRPLHKRKNWFINLEVFDEQQEITFCHKDIRIETMRSSGNGGQNVNKVESAVRITHIPTGLTAVAREERSQAANKKLALARFAKLVASIRQNKAMEANQEIWKQHTGLERGNPVRVYKGLDFQRTQ